MVIRRWRFAKKTMLLSYPMCLMLCTACIAEPKGKPTAEQEARRKAAGLKVISIPKAKGEPAVKKKKVGQLDSRMQKYVDEARNDLAAKLGGEKRQIEVVDARYITWRDSSLGCPKPGFAYTQALVEGVKIVLVSAGTAYNYHGAKNKAPRLCEKPKLQSMPKKPLPGGVIDR